MTNSVKIIIASLLCIGMLFAIVLLMSCELFKKGGNASDEGLTFVFDETSATYSVSGYTGKPASVNIPSTYKGYPVTSIGKDAFYGCKSLTSIEIPESVTSIDYCAFYECKKLMSINFNGTEAQWKAIFKEAYWKNSAGYFTVYCTDGYLSYSEA